MKEREIDRCINEFSGLIRGVIVKLCPRVRDADLEDIEQEVKIRIWGELKKEEKQIRNLGSYIWKVSYTTACTMLKDISKKREVPVESGGANRPPEERIENPQQDRPDADFERKQLRELIAHKVEELGNPRRQVIKLYLLGMRRREISDFYGWSRDRVRNLLHRGLKDLRENLKKSGIDAGFGDP